MYCTKCGAQVAEAVSYCPKCGAAMNQPQAPAASSQTSLPVTTVKTNGMAVASMVLGIVSLLINPVLICSILAIVFGTTSMGQINRSNGTQKGKGMATAGLVLGIVSIIITILIFVLVGVSLSWLSDIGSGFHY